MEPAPPKIPRFTKRQKVTAGGILSTAAAIATILSFLLSADNNQSDNNKPSANISAAYPAASQQNYLSSCESGGGTVSYCGCTLQWFEANVSYAQFVGDNQLASEGTVPTDLVSAESACD